MLPVRVSGAVVLKRVQVKFSATVHPRKGTVDSKVQLLGTSHNKLCELRLYMVCFDVFGNN